MKQFSLPLLAVCLLAACSSTNPSAPNPSASSTPAPSASPSQSSSPSPTASPQPLSKVTAVVDLSSLKAEDQSLVKDQLIYVDARLANQPQVSPSALPGSSLDPDLTPTAPEGVEVTTTPAWGPLRVRAGQKVVFDHLPAGQAVEVQARLTYRAPGKIGCESGATRTFIASARTNALASSELKLSLTELVNNDLSACQITIVYGTVVDANGQALPDAKVSLSSLNNSIPLELTTQTDTKGNYSLQKVYPGVQYKIRVEKSGYFPADRTEVPRSNDDGNPNANRYDFRLQKD